MDKINATSTNHQMQSVQDNLQIVHDAFLTLAANAERTAKVSASLVWEEKARVYEYAASMVNSAAAASGIVLETKTTVAL